MIATPTGGGERKGRGANGNRMLARWACFGIAILFTAATAGAAALPVVSDAPAPGSVALVANRQASDIYVDLADYPLAQLVAERLADDVQRVTGVRPRVVHDPAKLSKHAIILGTLGHSAAIDQIASRGMIYARGLRGQWETSRVIVLPHPLPGVDSAVVIVGSDRRGTAYGAFDLSRAIGVSPWYWWADVAPTHRDAIYVQSGGDQQGPPAVKYRGIFINDEDWGLQPWAAHTFDPQFGNIGAKTYEKVFELILRLRGNLLWPAMHPCSTEFGQVPQNVTLADQWGIVMGASHTEAMNRNNVAWPTLGLGPWNYQTNREDMLAFWREWAQERGRFEAVWSVGLRGVHDSPMNGPKDTAGKVKLLEQAISDQRKLLAEYVNPDVAKVPQAFTPYKETLELYRAGLKVPDDVTLVWPDDNYGYIRQLSTPAEQKRSGGAGVYYHISYLGSPFSYVWLNTTPPALIWEEMTKAYANGAKRLWVLNVGDIKPGEVGIDFWFKLAWNPDVWTATTQNDFLRIWAEETFGPAQANAIADVMRRYYILGFQRKPEALTPDSFNLAPGGEAQRRMADYRALAAEAERIARTLPPARQASYFELVLYPVQMCDAANRVFIETGYQRLYTHTGNTAAARTAAERARSAMAQVTRQTAYYNDTLQGGKWKDMMTAGGMTGISWGFHWPREVTDQQATNSPTAATPAPPQPPAPAEPAVNPSQPLTPKFAERNGVVSIVAGHFSHAIPKPAATWTAVPGLGRTGDAVVLEPTTASSIDDPSHLPADSPSLQYDFTANTTGPVSLHTCCLPTYPLNPQRKLRFAVAIDNEPPQVVDLADASAGKRWAKNVTDNTVDSITHHTLRAAGQHHLHVWMIDPGVVLDKLVIDCGGLQSSALGPPETPAE